MTESIGNEFIHKTYYQHLSTPPQKQGVPLPALQIPIPPGSATISLPGPEAWNLPPADLRTVIQKRSSLRQYAPEPLQLHELAFLLWSTQGVRHVNERGISFRTVPSAGSRHAFETYLLINQVNGVPGGLYRYAAIDNLLVEVNRSATINAEITEGCLSQEHVSHSAVTFIWAAVVERMFWRYVERGYRYLFLDAGHVCQNLYLASEAIGCGVCAIAAYDDEKLNKAIGLDGESIFAVYAAALGKRA